MFNEETYTLATFLLTNQHLDNIISISSLKGNGLVKIMGCVMQKLKCLGKTQAQLVVTLDLIVAVLPSTSRAAVTYASFADLNENLCKCNTDRNGYP